MWKFSTQGHQVRGPTLSSQYENCVLVKYLSFFACYRPRYFVRCLLHIGYHCSFGVLVLIHGGCYGLAQTRGVGFCLVEAPATKLPLLINNETSEYSRKCDLNTRGELCSLCVATMAEKYGTCIVTVLAVVKLFTIFV